MTFAKTLMMIAAASGLANNFAAISSLITTGIQTGHMKMHLSNILNQLNASSQERILVNSYFTDKTVSFTAVDDFIRSIRSEG